MIQGPIIPKRVNRIVNSKNEMIKAPPLIPNQFVNVSTKLSIIRIIEMKDTDIPTIK